ncbi:hypothetical protein K501DRAFT_335547 [Backusella circina FSU 941]|nr:hypothetical protein K501DRAFT_335547 [Backusella circina FSU 941]
MTSNTRTNRSNKKTSTSNTLKIKKKKHLRRSTSADPETQQQQQQQQDQQKDDELMIDASQHPEYVELMEQLKQSKQKRINKVHNWKEYERRSITSWYHAQKSQAWNEFYNARKRLRSDLLDQVQKKIIKLKQEVQQLNKQQLVPCDYEDWMPPERLSTISSFVSGVTDNEADRDLLHARQPFDGTPHLVYSDDDESRSTTGEETYPYLVTSTSSNTLRNNNYHNHEERRGQSTNYYR